MASTVTPESSATTSAGGCVIHVKPLVGPTITISVVDSLAFDRMTVKELIAVISARTKLPVSMIDAKLLVPGASGGGGGGGDKLSGWPDSVSLVSIGLTPGVTLVRCVVCLLPLFVPSSSDDLTS